MAVYRVQRTRDYTVMSNYHLKDKGLTLKSKGLLSMILSLPEEWNYTTRGLASICKEGVDAIGSALKELETAGYIVRRQLRGANGRITDTEYIIYEQPQPKKLDMLPSDVVSPDTENPDMVKPDTEKPAELNIEKSNTEGERRCSPFGCLQGGQNLRSGADRQLPGLCHVRGIFRLETGVYAPAERTDDPPGNPWYRPSRKSYSYRQCPRSDVPASGGGKGPAG